MGQSNAEYLVGSLPDHFNGEAEIFAFGGSALIRRHTSSSRPNNYWLEDNHSAGPRLNEFLASGLKPTRVIWIQGEQDSTKITNASWRNRYRNALISLFSQIKSATGCDDFGIVKIGQRLNSNKEIGIQFVRDAQQMVADSLSNTRIVGDAYDLDMLDHVHWSHKGGHELLSRIEADKPIPYVKSATYNKRRPKQVLVELANVKQLYRGSKSSPLLTIRRGGRSYPPKSIKKISESLLEITSSRSVDSNYYFHVAFDKSPNIDDTGSRQIRNEHLVPLSAGSTRLVGATWS